MNLNSSLLKMNEKNRKCICCYNKKESKIYVHLELKKVLFCKLKSKNFVSYLHGY